jgi:hypothetical protein
MKYALAVVVLAGSAVLVSGMPQEADPEPIVEAIKAKTEAFYGHWNNGEVEEAFGMIMLGGHGFLDNGGDRVEIPDADIRAAVIEEYSAGFEAGMKLRMVPREIRVDAVEHGAAASFLIDRTVTPPGGESEQSTARVTLVWTVDSDGEWRMIHWHMSEHEAAPEESDAADEDSGAGIGADEDGDADG